MREALAVVMSLAVLCLQHTSGTASHVVSYHAVLWDDHQCPNPRGCHSGHSNQRSTCVSMCLHKERVLGTGCSSGCWKVATWGRAAKGGLSPTEGGLLVTSGQQGVRPGPGLCRRRTSMLLAGSTPQSPC